MSTCPFCSEEIAADAAQCPSCGMELPGPSPANVGDAPPVQPSKSNAKKWILIGGAGRVILVVIFALPGALLALFLGVMTFAFTGDGGPFTEFEVLCWFLWAGVGGACLGASPGLLLGLVLRVWWVLPALGAAAGFALSWRPTENSTVPMRASVVLVGLVVGLVLLVLVVLQGNRRRGGRESQQARGVAPPQGTDKPVGHGSREA